jgi:hypothetical protein
MAHTATRCCFPLLLARSINCPNPVSCIILFWFAGKFVHLPALDAGGAVLFHVFYDSPGILCDYQFFIGGNYYYGPPGALLAYNFCGLPQTGVHLIIQFQSQKFEALGDPPSCCVGILPYSAGENQYINSSKAAAYAPIYFFTL